MTTLRGVTWEHARGYDCMVASSAAYNGLVPDVRIEWDFRSLLEFGDAPIDELVTNYDLLVIDHPHVPTAARDGLLAPLDGVGHDAELARQSDQTVGRSFLSYSHDGRQWALASDAAAQVSAHRPDLIADPPTDWDGVLELAREGRVIWPTKPVDAFSSAVSIAGAFGATPASRPGTFLDDTAFGRVMGLMHELAENMTAENLGRNPIDAAEALVSSEYACYSPLLFGYSNYSRRGYRRRRLRYRDVPAGPAGIGGSLLGGAGIAVSARSRFVREARAFAVWVAGADAQRGVYFDGGGQPGNAGAWEDDRLNAETDDFFRGTRATLEQAYLRPRTDGYLAFQNCAGPLITAALGREISDEQLHERLEEAAASLLVEAAS